MIGVLAILLLAACTSTTFQGPLTVTQPTSPHFDPGANTFYSFDGARLGLTEWPAETSGSPEYVVVGVHGMNDYAQAFHMAAPYWAAHGVTTYAYDQRGFGRSAGRGLWPVEELMREDLRTAVDIARERHPDAIVTVVGISMGGSVSISAFGSDRPPGADRFIASGPGLRGWGALNPAYKASLWLSTRTRPSWIVRPPRRFVRIEPSDNVEMLQRTWSDPLMMPTNRIDQVYGVVKLMESAHESAPQLPASVPTLMSYGANDYVIPQPGVERTAKVLPGHVRTVYYANGYHMLLRDLQAQVVFDDYLAFMRDPEAEMPSGAPVWPFR